MKNKKLVPPDDAHLWLVATNQPFYPSVKFFASQEEAVAFANKEIEFAHDDNGVYDDSSVTIAAVVEYAPIKTNC